MKRINASLASSVMRWAMGGAIAATALVNSAHAQVAFPAAVAEETAYAMEDMDWGVNPTTTAKKKPYHAPTPKTIPGARVISTTALQQLLRDNKDVVVIDVLDTKTRKSIPGALWLNGAGSGDFYNAEKERFTAVMEKITEGNKSRPIVFLCVSSECWLSYNASLHALDIGYKDVIWYRGGSNAWRGANLNVKVPTTVEW